MAELSRLNTWTVFRCTVVPALLLCSIFRRAVFQWVALAASVIWISIVLLKAIGTSLQRRKRENDIKEISKIPETVVQEETQSRPEDSKAALFLVRQVNYRITEHLKESYPSVSWLWTERPSVEELCDGGIWKIRLSGAEPYNYGEVAITSAGKMSITMLQAVSLHNADTSIAEELKPEEMLERVDVRAWFDGQGENALVQMIDELNTQGHKRLTIKENGDVCVEECGVESRVDTLADFPPKSTWKEFCSLLMEDDIDATVQDDSLALSW